MIALTGESRGFAAAFLVGFLGWLAVAALRPAAPWLWLAPFGLGLVAAAMVPRPFGLVALLLGIGVSYPAALGVGVISYLGENWSAYLTVFLSAASAGFGVGLLAVAGLGSISRRDSRPEDPAATRTGR
jgi:hypothetical protein